jgi:A118 family predicted phage portal protein
MRPSVANNIDTDSPLGISVYANSLDTLEALDIAFDSFSREFILGRKRIIVPASAIRTVPDPDNPGKTVRYFDADDEVYQAFKDSENDETKITDNTMTLRIEEHVSAINALLNILCFQVGLSPGTLSFDAVQGLKTATEVISQNSKTYRTKQSHQNIIKEVLEDTVKSIINLGIAVGDLTEVKEYEVTIGFDDSIIVDENAIIDNNIKLVAAGLKSKLRAIKEILKCDDKTAQAELDQISKEEQVTGNEADMFGTDNNNPPPGNQPPDNNQDPGQGDAAV